MKGLVGIDVVFHMNSSLRVRVADLGRDDKTSKDTIEFSGLFVQYLGQTRMEPIVRTGTLAMLPDEPVMTTLGRPGHVYLAEAHAYGGNSGSPMFVNVGGVRGQGISSQNFKLLGVVAGEVFETENLELKIATSYKGSAYGNSGISMIVPVDDVLALVNSPALKSQRDAIVSSELQKRTPQAR